MYSTEKKPLKLIVEYSRNMLLRHTRDILTSRGLKVVAEENIASLDLYNIINQANIY